MTTTNDISCPKPLAVALLSMVGIVVLASVLMFCTGCSSVSKLPPGANLQMSTTGFRVSPQAIDAPLLLGQSTLSIQMPSPSDSGASLNRNQVDAGLSGVRVTSTVAQGPVGEQLKQAGGPAALAILLQQREDNASGDDPPSGE